jgi:Flp pilus assembly protein TadG
MLHRRDRGEREHGQIIVLFALVLVVILVFAAIAVDLGVLRNNKQILRNTMDAAALAGGTLLPVDGSVAPVGSKATAAKTLIDSTIQKNYPGLPTSAYTIAYRCLVGVTGGVADVSQVTAGVCNPTHALGHAPVAGDFTGAGATRSSACNPYAGDKCNVVVVTGSATTQYGFGGVVGITSGSTGAIQSAACNGPCGAPPVIPVDVVLIMDRTASMSAQDIADIQSGANSVLSVFNPTVQRIALGTIGPSSPGNSACPSGSTSPLKSLAPPANQVLGVGMSNSSNINFFTYPADLPKWIAVGYSGLDGAPNISYAEAYSINGVTQTTSTIWKAISCLYSYTTGTNLDTPVMMAQQYLTTYGRPGVKKGIILETDGLPQAGDGSAHYTCNAANNNAIATKKGPDGIAGTTDDIEIFTIGFGVGTSKCPTRSGPVCSGSTGSNSNETTGWSCQPASALLASMATDASHFYDAPDSATVKAAFTQAAENLAGVGLHLIQLYPTPVVTGVGPSSGTHVGGNSVVITGQYFSGAFSVTFGGGAAAFTVTSDTSINVTAPAGTTGTTVDVIVTTGGGASPLVSADHYTYTP